MTASRDPLHYLRSLPDAKANNPGFDLNTVKSNVSREQLSLAMNMFSDMAWRKDAYLPEIGRKIVPVECNVWKRDRERIEAETVFEVTVEEAMRNRYGGLSGACTALIFECCSVAAIIQLGIYMNLDASGVSQDMNFKFFQATPIGTTVRIVSTSLAVGRRVSAVRTDMYDKSNGRLLVTAMHTTRTSSRAKPM